jgi:hypothetical protein
VLADAQATSGRADEIAVAKWKPTALIRDFAGVIMTLDLVISVQNTTIQIHMCGA